MTEYSIEIGSTEGFRRIGIKPPVDIEQREQIFRVLGSEVEREAVGNGLALNTTTPHSGPAYSEIALTFNLSDLSGQRFLDIVSSIRGVLEGSDHTVMIDPDPKPIGFGRHLFGGQAERLG
jgi:hypothetical protein